MAGSITLFCTIQATLIAAITYYYTYVKPPLENKKYLIDRFYLLKDKTRSLREKLIAYADKHNVYEDVFMQQLTFRECINILAKSEYELANEDNLEIIKKAKPSRHLDNTIKLYEDQIKHVNEINTIYELFLKNI